VLTKVNTALILSGKNSSSIPIKKVIRVASELHPNRLPLEYKQKQQNRVMRIIPVIERCIEFYNRLLRNKSKKRVLEIVVGAVLDYR
jgi:hypothetical protein